VQTKPENPNHYNIPGTTVQLIDVLKAAALDYDPWDFFLWSSMLQYAFRWRHKGTPLDYLRKCRVYLDWLIESLEENGEETYTHKDDSTETPRNV
jgi:hypothetical protein